MQSADDGGGFVRQGLAAQAAGLFGVVQAGNTRSFVCGVGLRCVALRCCVFRRGMLLTCCVRCALMCVGGVVGVDTAAPVRVTFRFPTSTCRW